MAAVNWDRVDPFAALRKVGADHLFLMLCLTTLLSYLPEAGEYSAFFVYLRLVIGFSETQTAYFIAFVGVLSVAAQSFFLDYLMRTAGAKRTIFVGLLFEFTQLCWYAFTSSFASMWIAGGIAALGSITYPAISAFVSAHAAMDEQGVAQGVITGIRGLCSGLGPAIFGFIFYLFQIDLNAAESAAGSAQSLALPARTHTRTLANTTLRSGLAGAAAVVTNESLSESIMPGPPFAFGAALVLLALLVSTLIPDDPHVVIAVQAQRSSHGNVVEVVESTEREVDRRPENILIEQERPVTACSDLSLPTSNSKIFGSSPSSQVTLGSSYSHLHTAMHSSHSAAAGSRATRSHSTIGFSAPAGTASADYALLGQIDSDD